MLADTNLTKWGESSMFLRDLIIPIAVVYKAKNGNRRYITDKNGKRHSLSDEYVTRLLCDAAFGKQNTYSFDEIAANQTIKNWFDIDNRNPAFLTPKNADLYKECFSDYCFDNDDFVERMGEIIGDQWERLKYEYTQSSVGGRKIITPSLSEKMSDVLDEHSLFNIIADRFMAILGVKSTQDVESQKPSKQEEQLDIIKNAIDKQDEDHKEMSEVLLSIEGEVYENRKIATEQITVLEKLLDSTTHSVGSMAYPTNPHQPQAITIQHENSCYVGEYAIDKETGQPIPHGHGKLSWDDGAFYVGEFVYNVRCGRGALTTINGTTIHTNWENNRMNGNLRATNDVGVWIGYSDDKRAEINKIEFHSGYIFEGTLTVDSVKGKLTHPDGRNGRFISNNVLGLRILSGDEDIKKEILQFPYLIIKTRYFDNGSVYFGEMDRDDNLHGWGRIQFPNDMILVLENTMGLPSDDRGLWIFPRPTFFDIETLECVWQVNEWVGSYAFDEEVAKFTLSPEGDITSIRIIHKDDSWDEVVEYTSDKYIWVKSSNGTEYKGDLEGFFRLMESRSNLIG